MSVFRRNSFVLIVALIVVIVIGIMFVGSASIYPSQLGTMTDVAKMIVSFVVVGMMLILPVMIIVLIT